MEMTPIQHARKVIRDKGLKISHVEQALGWGNGTLQENKSKSMSWERAVALAEFLDVSPDFLMTGKERQPDRKSPALSPEAIALGRDFDKLDAPGKKTVRVVLESELERVTAHGEDIQYKYKVIPLMENRAAAGYGDPDFGLGWSDYEVPADSPAEFAIHVHGESMSPYLEDGSIALGVKRQPTDGETGVFLVDGQFYVKQFHSDRGEVFLYSLNRDFSDADLHLSEEGEHQFVCFGTVLLKRLPLPR